METPLPDVGYLNYPIKFILKLYCYWYGILLVPAEDRSICSKRAVSFKRRLPAGNARIRGEPGLL